MSQDISDEYILCAKGEVVPISAEAKALAEKAISAHLKDFSPHNNFDKIKLEHGKSGAVPGGKFSDDSGDEYYYKKLISETEFPEQGLHDYLLGTLYQRILYDRAPSNNIFRHTDDTKIEDSFVTSKMLKRYDGSNPSPTLGLAKAMAAAIFMNEQDFRNDNLIRIESGYLAKIDHGRSAEGSIWGVHRMTKELALYQKTVDWCRVEPIEFLDCLRQIVQISDDEIEALILNRAQFLKANGWDKEADAKYFAEDLKKNLETCREYLNRVDDLIKKFGNDALKTLTLVEAGDIDNFKIYELAKEIGLTNKDLRKMYGFCFQEHDRLKLFEELKALVDEYDINSVNLPPIFWEYDSQMKNELCKIAKLFEIEVGKIIGEANPQHHDSIIQEALFYAIRESQDPTTALEKAKLSEDVFDKASIEYAQFFTKAFAAIESGGIGKEFVSYSMMRSLLLKVKDVPQSLLKDSILLFKEYGLNFDNPFFGEIFKKNSLDKMKKFFDQLRGQGIEIKDLELESTITASTFLRKIEDNVERIKLLKENGITEITRKLLMAREENILELIQEFKANESEASGTEPMHEALSGPAPDTHDDSAGAFHVSGMGKVVEQWDLWY